MATKTSDCHTGFTLLELSIVLVIIGLIVGGITVGSSMIRAAELRSIITDQQRFSIAINVFKDKYFAFPGDMNNATNFWGIAGGTGNDVTCRSTVSTGTETCNGDSDGVLDGSYEGFRMWQHLANAELISGAYSGVASNGYGNAGSIGGQNIPIAKIPGGAWVVWNANNFGGSGTSFAGDYDNLLQLGAEVANNYPINPLLSPEEAWNIDVKLDDGKPGQGSVWVRLWATCTDATTNTDTDADYDLSNKEIACALAFPKFVK